MAIPEIPTGNFTILCLAAVLLLIYGILCYVAYLADRKELRRRRLFYRGHVDLIFRLRGSMTDSSLVLYRDDENSVFEEGSYVNLGVVFPQFIGDILEIDIACDSDGADEAECVISVSDVYVRQITRSSLPRTKFSDKDEANMSTWAAVETLTGQTGFRVVGIKTYGKGREHLLRARDVAETFTMTQEVYRLKQWALVGYRALHYLISLSKMWHDPWSDFSCMDHVLVMCLDQLATLVVVCTCFAFAFETYVGGTFIISQLEPYIQDGTVESFANVDEFNLFALFSPSLDLFKKQALNLILCFWICIVACLAVIPISLIWCRLFRLIGGKGFESSLQDNLPIAVSSASLGDKPLPSEGPACSARWNGDIQSDSFDSSSNSLLLRTLECKSTHTASCVTSTRRLRMEPMITNCKPDHITARSVAYVRTKMTRLRDEDILSGARGIKEPDILHESHSQSTDAPVMPVPSTALDGKGEILRVTRFCERLIQQGSEHIRDNSIITECFEVGEEGKPFEIGGGDPSMCCPRQCCRRLNRCQQESFSNATFFTEDDAASVKEMMSNFSLTVHPRHEGEEVANENLQESFAPVQNLSPPLPPPPPPRHSRKETDEALRVLADMFEDPLAPTYGSRDTEEDSFFGRVNRPSTVHPTTSTATGSDFTSEILIGRSSSSRHPSELEMALKRVGKKISGAVGSAERRIGRKMSGSGQGSSERDLTSSSSRKNKSRHSKSAQSVPQPSGTARSRFSSTGVASEFDDTQVFQAPKKRRKGRYRIPLKGTKFKLIVFAILAGIQLGEMALVCVFKWNANMFYTKDGSSGVGRMHCALLSSILAILFYFALSVHLVALCSCLLDRIRLSCTCREPKMSDYYEVG